jgi:adenosylcobyric acid synthase
MEENEVVVIEGAGSPAEINLADVDYVNLETVRLSGATCLLVSDIDRGGAFAHLFGTWSLLPSDLRSHLRGFVLNKFRGDATLLEPGPTELFARTGMPLLGTIPRIHHDLPDEDAVALDQFSTGSGGEDFKVGVVAWPRISNFDEFRRMGAWPGVGLRLVRKPADVEGLDLLILPGSKHVPSDLAWLRERGLDASVREFAASGKPVLGVCGGMQALGGTISDPFGREGNAQGLGLLQLTTLHGEQKIVRKSTLVAPHLEGWWSALSGRELSGYEIRTGTVAGEDPDSPEGRLQTGGNVLGLYLHGVFEDARVLMALFGGNENSPDPLERTFDRLADLVEEHLDMKTICSWVDPSSSSSVAARGHGRLCILTGGARSGKSSAAQALGREWGGDNVTFLATSLCLDQEMTDRVRAHREDRPSAWETLEEPLDVSGVLRLATHRVVVLDCLGMLATNHLLSGGSEAFRNAVENLLRAWRESGADLIVVTNEVGSGVVPDNALSREFRDRLGWANQRLVAESTEAWLCVAGVRIPLRNP